MWGMNVCVNCAGVSYVIVMEDCKFMCVHVIANSGVCAGSYWTINMAASDGECACVGELVCDMLL